MSARRALDPMGACRRVPRETAPDVPRCPDCRSTLERNPNNHLPDCPQRALLGIPWKPPVEADEVIASLIDGPKQQELTRKPPEQSQESPVTHAVPVMVAAPVPVAGGITVRIHTPAGVPVHLEIIQTG